MIFKAALIKLLLVFSSGVTKFGPGGPVSCRVYSSNPNQTHLKQLIKVLLGILQTSRQVCWGKLELNPAGHRPSRNKFDDPWFSWFLLVLMVLHFILTPIGLDALSECSLGAFTSNLFILCFVHLLWCFFQSFAYAIFFFFSVSINTVIWLTFFN